VTLLTRKAEQSEATRRAILEAATELFGERGYAETPLEDVVARAGVTRGALYHHFKDKVDLFHQVHHEVIQSRVHSAVLAAMKGNAWDRLTRGCGAFLDLFIDPAFRRIVTLDSRSVLEHHQDKHDDEDKQMLLNALQAAVDEGFIEPQPLEPLCHLLMGALSEAALMIARSDDAKKTRNEVGAGFERLLGGLRKPGS
jgi:AcrR family transcriptional regulator